MGSLICLFYITIEYSHCSLLPVALENVVLEFGDKVQNLETQLLQFGEENSILKSELSAENSALRSELSAENSTLRRELSAANTSIHGVSVCTRLSPW